jgi:hypothetical protein
LGRLYANNKYKFDQRNTDGKQIKLINYGNLPARFEWNQIQNDDYSVFFEPPEGVLHPKKEIPFLITLIPKKGGHFTYFFTCKVEG